ncbi:E3 ubiquitin-protein ligase RNF181 homolog [Papaver somniferum]|uniref:E3 ubiquitin-protein ligase RNF181 homolog n=1 Tax=Papaver somniferum TaxID=3469 RepID=UPI000E6FD293|nr:E3 ubiquitin-protein ligase RNF181 homolog [Papaver somniferum]
MVDLIDFTDRVIEIAKKRARLNDSCSSDLQALKLNSQTQRLALERSILTGVDYSITFVETHKAIERRIEEEMDNRLNTKKVVVLDDGDVCSICLQDIDTADGGDDDDGAARVLNCSHTFHSRCISEWRKRKTNCPLCRHDMEKEQEQRCTVKRRKVDENPIIIIL